MPSTVKEVFPSHTWVPGVVIPKRSAAFDPNTTPGYRDVASFSQVPRATFAETTSSRFVGAAIVKMPPVAFGSIKRERYTETPDKVDVEEASVTPGIIRMRPTESSGRIRFAPERSAPERAVSMLVPSAWSCS